MTRGQVLIVDDDSAFVDLYREILEGEGHAVQVASTVAAATTTLTNSGSEFDVVLIDQKLQGPGGPDSGIELLKATQNLAPFAKAIMVTGYASPQAIEAAFAAGVYDYLVKNGAFEALLKAKVRNAVEVTSEKRLGSLRGDALTTELRGVWADALTQQNPHRKGALLELVMKLLFKSIPGFEEASTNIRTDSEEIDVVVRNRSTDPFWAKEGQYLFGECKNWSTRSDAAEARNFSEKLQAKRQRASMGLFFSVNGFTEGFKTELVKRSERAEVVIPFDREQITAWIEAPDRLAFLTARHQQTVVGR